MNLEGLVRIAGDLAAEDGAPMSPMHTSCSLSIAKPLEQQVADRMIERRLDYALIVNSGNRVGRVNDAYVLGANSARLLRNCSS